MSSFFTYDRLLEAPDICNFTEEAKRLAEHVKAGRAVRIYGRRNFGKTSIIKNIVARQWEQEAPERRVVFFVDLYSVQSLADLSFEFTKAFNMALSTKRKAWEKGLDWLKVLSRVRPTWTPPVDASDFGSFSIKTEAGASLVDFQTVLANIAALQQAGSFEFLIVLDEFQEIGLIPQAAAKLRTSLEALGRGLPIVVLGSAQHLLEKIFQTPRAPFYHWGTSVEFGYIPYHEYHEYIAERWRRAGKSTTAQATRALQDSVDRIPESINRLADFIASQPGDFEVLATSLPAYLGAYLDQSLSIYAHRFAGFSVSQRRVLRALAREHRAVKVLGAEFVAAVGKVSKTGIDRILKQFLNDGVVYRDFLGKEQTPAYILADPLFRHYLVRYQLLD